MYHSLVSLRFIDFYAISLYHFFKGFLLQNVLRLEPIVALLKAIYPASFYHATSKGKCLADTLEYFHFCLCCLFSKTT